VAGLRLVFDMIDRPLEAVVYFGKVLIGGEDLCIPIIFYLPEGCMDTFHVPDLTGRDGVVFLDDLCAELAYGRREFVDDELAPVIQRVLQDRLDPEKGFEGGQFGEMEMVKERDILAHELDLLLAEGTDVSQELKDALQIAFEIECFLVVYKFPRKKEGIRLEMEELIEGDAEVRAKRPDLVEGEGLFRADAAVGAVDTDVEQIGDLVYEGEMRRKVVLDVLEEDLLDTRRILHA